MLFSQNVGDGGLSDRFETFVPTGVPAGHATIGLWGRPALGDLSGDGRQDFITDGTGDQIIVAQNFIQAVEMENLVVRPAQPTVTFPWYRGVTLRAYGIFSDGSEIEISGAADWQPDNPNIVSGEGGRIVALAVGDLTVTATYRMLQASADISIQMIPAGTEPGYPDVYFGPTFNDFGGVVNSVAHQSGGDVLAGGYFQKVNGIPASNLARIRSDASFDAEFSGHLGDVNGTVTKVLVLPDDSIYIIGQFTQVGSHGTLGVARLHPNGTVDTSFTSETPGIFLTAHLDPDGRILVGGLNIEVPDRPGSYSLIRMLPDGSEDPLFFRSPSGGDVRAIGVDENGRILIGGRFAGLRRLNQNGGTDSSFDRSAITNTVNDLVLQSDGKIVCAGSKEGEFVIRLQENGSLDETFDTSTHPFWGVTEALAIDSHDRILVENSFGVRRLLADGSLDESFGSDIHPDFAIQDMVVTEQGDLWVAGGRSSINRLGTMGIARIHLDAEDFTGWRARHFSYSDLHERELDWDTIMKSGQRELLFYYAFNQDPHNGSHSPFDLTASRSSSMRLLINPDARDASFRLLYCEDLQESSWTEFAHKPAFGTEWIVSDPQFIVSEENGGDILIEPSLLDANTLFIKAEVTLDGVE